MDSRSNPRLSESLEASLKLIEPSTVFPGVQLYPCTVRLKDHRSLDRVLLADAKTFRTLTGLGHPADIRGLDWIDPVDIDAVSESRFRLPAQFANKLYNAGEVGMGQMIFTLIFSDKKRWECFQGNIIDFPNFPESKFGKDVVDVLPGVGARIVRVPVAPPRWCVFSA